MKSATDVNCYAFRTRNVCEVNELFEKEKKKTEVYNFVSYLSNGKNLLLNVLAYESAKFCFLVNLVLHRERFREKMPFIKQTDIPSE